MAVGFSAGTGSEAEFGRVTAAGGSGSGGAGGAAGLSGGGRIGATGREIEAGAGVGARGAIIAAPADPVVAEPSLGRT